MESRHAPRILYDPASEPGREYAAGPKSDLCNYPRCSDVDEYKGLVDDYIVGKAYKA